LKIAESRYRTNILRNVVNSPKEAAKVVSELPNDDKQRYKIAIFAPTMANSQVLWNKRVGEELMKAGHDVTIYMMHFFEKKNAKVDIDSRIRIVQVNGSYGLDGEALMSGQAKTAFHDIPMWHAESRELMTTFSELLWKSCGVFIKNKEFLAHVESSKYDIAFTHM
ncbi:hypothetical protein PENTCL1PPCAC_8756, partial [Pristionchus entomophagus]